jgi:radical SAM protein with 4Fe4S-binding SPASM domain
MSNPKVLYILECDHIMPGSIYTGNVMDCYNCDEIQKIKDVHVFEWSAFCTSCRYRAWCGLSQPLAAQNINGHIRKHPDHKGKVLYLRNPLGMRIQTKLNEAK